MLQVQDGEFVGKTIFNHRGLARAYGAGSVISDEFEEAVLYLEMEESLTQGIIAFLVRLRHFYRMASEIVGQVLVVRRLDNAIYIHWINRYPADSCSQNVNI